MMPVVPALGDGIFVDPSATAGEHRLGQMTYVDDVALPVEADHCDLILGHAAEVARFILRAA